METSLKDYAIRQYDQWVGWLRFHCKKYNIEDQNVNVMKIVLDEVFSGKRGNVATLFAEKKYLRKGKKTEFYISLLDIAIIDSIQEHTERLGKLEF